MLILLIIAILSPALKQRLIGQLEHSLLRLSLSYKLSCSTQSLLISFFLKGPQIPTGFTPPPPTSNSLDLCDSSQPPKPLSNTFNETLIGQVISTEKVFSDIQCIDFCLRSLSCKAYNMESRGSTIYCITLATIERRQEKYGSSCRVFDREKIEKVCSLKKSLSALSILCFHLLHPPPFFLGLTGVYLIITLFSIENSLYPKKSKSIPMPTAGPVWGWLESPAGFSVLTCAPCCFLRASITFKRLRAKIKLKYMKLLFYSTS